MKLSARLLSYYLKKKYDVTESSVITADPNLRYALITVDTGVEDEGIVYITSSSLLWRPEQMRNVSLTVFLGKSIPQQHLNEANVIAVSGAQGPEEVLASIQDIFDLFNQWDEDCMASRLHNHTIQDLLDLTSPIIPNPMVVISMDFTVLASRGVDFGELRNSVLGTNEKTLDMVIALKTDPVYAALKDREGAFFYPGNSTIQPHLCVNIQRYDETVYRLMMGIGPVPMEITFGFVLEHLAAYITHALSTNTVISHDSAFSLHRIFQTILTDPSADYVEVSQQLTNLGWLSEHIYRCMLIEAGILDARNLTLRSICSYIENAVPGSCAVEHRGNAVVFINLNLCTLGENEAFQRLVGFIRDSMLNAGYSRKLLGHFNFQRMYVQASLALKVGRRKNPSRWIHHFNDIALTYILEQTTAKLPAYMVADEKLLTLKNMADSENSPLYETLRIYLEKHQNITRTSEALFIHRSTLLYRLDKIHSMLHLDLDDPAEVLYLLLSYHILDMEEENNAASSKSRQSRKTAPGERSGKDKTHPQESADQHT